MDFFSLYENGIEGKEQNYSENATYPVKTLMEWIDNGKLMTPDWQRDSTSWNETRKNELIRSLLEGDKTGVFIFSMTKVNGKTRYHIIDGLQRITAISSFINNEYPVKLVERKSNREVDVFFSKPSAKGFLLDEEGRDTFLNAKAICWTYSNLSEEEQIKKFSRIQNQLPLSPGQRINYYAYENVNTPAKYCVDINLTLINNKVLEKSLKSPKDKHEKTKYNTLVGAILLKSLGRNVFKHAKEHLSVNDLDNLKKPSHLPTLKARYGDNGERLVRIIEDICGPLQKKNRHFNSRSRFIAFFNDVVKNDDTLLPEENFFSALRKKKHMTTVGEK